jgi:tripartite-type tricarboxylate transporter receptor subunit TctC
MLRRTLLAGAAALAVGPALAQAQPQGAWPSRPIRWILPDAPGGGNDITARLIAPFLETALGQPWVIDNRPGAGGRIGVEAAFRAAPDGYSFLLGNAGATGINAAIYRDLPYDLTTAFEPVSLLVLGPNVLVVNPRLLPVANVGELVERIRARPGAMNYASGGVGASNHLGMELLKHMLGLDIVHVPYRSAQAMAQAVISGDAPVMFANLVNAMPFIRSGEVKAIAVTTATRSPMLPDIPTMQESGIAGYETAAWNGLMAPRGTPRPIIHRLHAELVKLRDNAEIRRRIAAIGGDFVVSTPDEFDRRLREDIAKWKALAAAADIRAE